MNQKQIEALVKKNMARAGSSPGRKSFGKKYDVNLPDDPTDEAALQERERNAQFFTEMRKREF